MRQRGYSASPPLRAALVVLAYFAAVIVLPLIGVVASGGPVAPFLRFPPLTRPGDPEPFSWAAFGAVALVVVLSLAPLLWKIAASPPVADRRPAIRRRFPVFGWVGLLVLGASWIVAWNRFPWADPLQRYTFTPLWLSYIAVVNALTVVRTGSCPLLSEPRRIAALFPLSWAYWWSFEYLNRFVGNWHYPGAEALTAARYVLEASLPFSTVLPAVYSTAAWLGSHPGLSRGLDRLLQPRWLPAGGAAAVGLAASALLALIPLLPDLLFPLLWIAPPLLLAALQQLLLGDSILSRSFRSGDWRHCWTLALAGLACGFCWELWNDRSLAHWEYRIPYVGRFRVFAMPLLGYAGYLPFGIACGLMADCLRPDGASAPAPEGGPCGRSIPSRDG